MIATHHQGSAKERAVSAQTYARIAGVVFLVSFVAGGFGEFYAPSQLIVPGNAATTAHKIIGSDLFFRLGFVAYLGEAVTDVALTFLLYVLLRPVQANLALLAVFFRLMATATFAFAELFYFAPSLILGGDGYLKTFSPDQLHALALLSLSVYSAAGYLYIVFYDPGVLDVSIGIHPEGPRRSVGDRRPRIRDRQPGVDLRSSRRLPSSPAAGNCFAVTGPVAACQGRRSWEMERERERSECLERSRAGLIHDVACQSAPQTLPRRSGWRRG
jgi:hypothetical protein